jgi:CubicO group peptidase (beta-lactamase class C family)
MIRAGHAPTALAALIVLGAASGCKRSPAPEAADASPVHRPAPAPPSPTFDAEPYRARAKVPALAYAAFTRDEVVALGAAGEASHGRTATEDTRFEAASIAKTLIATCVMQLVDEGRMQLDDDVSSHLGFPVRHPGYPRPISLRMLLGHASSIRDRPGEVSAPRDVPLGTYLERYLGGFRRGPADASRRSSGRLEAFAARAPGTAYEYTNVGAALAAHAVEKRAGRSFEDQARERVFVPLRMAKTSYREGPLDAVPHALRDGGQEALRPPSHALYPVVDLRSTPRDLARFGRAILREGELDGERILTAEAVRTMLTPALPGVSADEALGWQLRDIGGARVVGHEGEDAGATTALFLDLEAGVGAVVLANGDAFQGGGSGRAEAIEAALATLLDEARSRAR